MTTNEELRRLHKQLQIEHPKPWRESDLRFLSINATKFVVAACNELPRLLNEIDTLREQNTAYDKTARRMAEEFAAKDRRIEALRHALEKLADSGDGKGWVNQRALEYLADDDRAAKEGA